LIYWSPAPGRPAGRAGPGTAGPAHRYHRRRAV